MSFVNFKFKDFDIKSHIHFVVTDMSGIDVIVGQPIMTKLGITI